MFLSGIKLVFEKKKKNSEGQLLHEGLAQIGFTAGS